MSDKFVLDHKIRMQFQEVVAKLLGYTKHPTWGTSYWTKVDRHGERHDLNLFTANWSGLIGELIIIDNNFDT